MVKIDIKDAVPSGTDRDEYYSRAFEALRKINNKTGVGSEYLGWVRLPENTDKDLLDRIRRTAERIRRDADAFVLIGIGGSYLSARAAVELLSSGCGPEILYAGTGLLRFDTERVLNRARDKNYYVNVITKSGSSTEPMLAYRSFHRLMVDTFGRNGASERTIATTTIGSGVLYEKALDMGCECFGIPEDVGGRYSALTPVALLPMAVAGLDIEKVIEGARKQMERSLDYSIDNPSLLYAVARQMQYKAGKKIEIFSYPGESGRFLGEWWKQLFGESEGKDGKGLFPASCQMTTDLHSLGQYIQDGERTIFETMLSFHDELNESVYMKSAIDGVRAAHVSGDVPFIDIEIERADEENLGALLYFFETACAISGYMLGVNPFDQPGVEAYKKEMRMRLEKAYERDRVRSTVK